MCWPRGEASSPPCARSASRLDQPDRLAGEESADVLDRARIIDAEILFDGVAEMRRDDHVIEFEEGMALGDRLVVEHVDGGAGDLATFKRREQCRLIDDRRARGVDEVSARLHAREI